VFAIREASGLFGMEMAGSGIAESGIEGEMSESG
jgi:hypothetical protein